MDPSSQTWPSSYYLECLDDHITPASNYYPSLCGFDQTTVSDASSTTLTFSNSHHQKGNNIPSSSQSLWFGNSSAISNPSSDTGTGSFAVKTEDISRRRMIYFHGSECIITNPSFVNVPEASAKRTRMPLQTRFRVLEERRRRGKLSRQFQSLSALVPGLSKMDKIPVMDGAISRIKQLEERLKILEEEGKPEKPACLCYHYEDNSVPLRKMEFRIQKEDVLIKINYKNPIGFTEETLASELKKLHLSVTEMKFLPFCDNMLAVSGVAKMKLVQFCQEEELANRIRQAILKLINMHIHIHEFHCFE